jgi:hypothetical protein
MYRYVLRSSAALLAEPKYIVGKTHCIVEAFNTHNSLLSQCEYSRKYLPWVLCDLKHASPHKHWEELNETLYYMKLFGIDNVRGAAWKSLTLRPCEKKTIQAILALR